MRHKQTYFMSFYILWSEGKLHKWWIYVPRTIAGKFVSIESEVL